MKINLERARIALSDPLASIVFAFEGREGVLRFKLSQLLQTKSNELKEIFYETDEFDEYVRSQLSLSNMKYIPPINFGKALYVICRVAKPVRIVETGVASGLSTAYILKALEKNGQGELYSIDIPNYEKILVREVPGYLREPLSLLPEGKDVGWLVPNDLRHDWHLTVGLTKDLLPTLCKSLGKVNVFLHDSEHTYENMYFEYTTVWPHLTKNGYLLSDDAWWNTAFPDFCREVKAKPTHVYTTGVTGVRKKR